MTDNVAVFSPDGRYRYYLSRYVSSFDLIGSFTDRGTLNVIGLNPSTADATTDDPTVRRMIGYARTWGFSKLVVTNVFAFRATDPRELKRVDDPVGPDGDLWLRDEARRAQMTLCAWSGLARYLRRSAEVKRLLRGVRLYCLGWTRHGEPLHPLYQKADLEPVRFV